MKATPILIGLKTKNPESDTEVNAERCSVP